MLRSLVNSTLDLIYPRKCPACKRARAGTYVHEAVCSSCWDSIIRNEPPFCLSCGRHLSAKRATKQLCTHCRQNTAVYEGAFAPCVYTGVIQELIHEFKYRGKDYLITALGALMVDFIHAFSLPVDMFEAVIPIPLHPVKLREREFNQAERLGSVIAQTFNLQLLKKALIRARDTPPQADLTDRQRRIQNVRGAFSVAQPDRIRGRNILMIDDVLTTSATVSEAARALKQRGAGAVFVLTLAN
ncbi:MAG: ComF family protein [Candidatus Omnitrophica bacterium]|nr:ComF family protein [Candidatus Omnitrophota bacterium]